MNSNIFNFCFQNIIINFLVLFLLNYYCYVHSKMCHICFTYVVIKHTYNSGVHIICDSCVIFKRMLNMSSCVYIHTCVTCYLFHTLHMLFCVTHNYNVYRKYWDLTKNAVKHAIKKISNDLRWYFPLICCVFYIPSPSFGDRTNKTRWIKIIHHRKFWEILYFFFIS